MKKKDTNYISIKDSRRIIRENIRQMKYYESLKRRKLSPSEYTSVMKNPDNIIEIDNLKTVFFTDNGTVMSVNGVSFDIPKKKIVGVVGESGCGKSVTSLSIMQLVHSGLWVKLTSSSWLPMVNTGFRLVIGSWKIIVMSLPRTLYISCVGITARLYASLLPFSSVPASSELKRISPPIT